MSVPINLILPDDEHYYFGVELPCSPEEVRERLLRKPEFLYSLTSEDEEEDEVYRTWLYLWRCNEGWEMRIGHLPVQEQIAQMHARHNMRLDVVLRALTEDEALRPSTYSFRNPLQYVLVEPAQAEGNLTLPHLNLKAATGNTDYVLLHTLKAAELPSFFGVLKNEPAEEVPQEVIDRYAQMYAQRALSVVKSIHDADSMELLLPLVNEYYCYSCNVQVRSSNPDEVSLLQNQVQEQEARLLLEPWYAGSHHQRHAHASGLVCVSIGRAASEFEHELLDFSPGRRLCYEVKEKHVAIIRPADEGEPALPQRENGRFHKLPDDCELFLYTPEGEKIETHWYYAPATAEDE